MDTPLRLGFLLSGLLHVAAVTAFSLTSEQEIPAIEDTRPLTLQLAMFKPEQAAPAPPVFVQEPPELQLPVEDPSPQLVEEPQQDIAPPPEPPPPEPVARTERPEPPMPKPIQPVKRVSTPKPVTRKRASVEPAKIKPRETKPVTRPPAPSSSAPLAAVAKPRAMRPTVDLQTKMHYLAALAAKINSSKYYPLSSRRRGEQGKVVVHFVVQKNGELTDLSIAESSGSRRLDAAAIKTLKRASPFLPIPDSLERDRWSVSVPIAFSLSG